VYVRCIFKFLFEKKTKKALDTFPDDNDTFHMKDGEERICAAQGIIATF